MSRGETIVAVATPPGKGGIGVVRVSGPATPDIGRALLGSLPQPRYARYADFRGADGQIIDTGLALFFKAPRSFTGEDVLELHGHGGPVVLDMLVEAVLDQGARLARPGEFSERAFLNDKIDLSQAEAIADLIDSVSREAVRGALRSMQGAFSERVGEISEAVLNLRIFVEAAIDFPEEEIDFLADDRVTASIEDIATRLDHIVGEAGQGALLREGFTLAIVGRPNAGKSSIMNCLTGADSSIVTAVPGTTRDVVREVIQIEGMPIRVVDTAGIRVSSDEIEVEGIRRAIGEAQRADQVLVVVDLSEHVGDWRAVVADVLNQLERGDICTVVLNKVDLVQTPDLELSSNVIAVSARTGEGMDLLRKRLASVAGLSDNVEGLYLARRRHLDALERAGRAVSEGRRQLAASGAGELLAEELRQCHQALCEITGEVTSDDLLGKIFSSFCIGK